MVKMDPDTALGTFKTLLKPNCSNEYAVQQYETSMDNYDELMDAMNYKGPDTVADAVAHYLKDNKAAEILDVATGTGMVGVKLKEHGFKNIDCLDPANRMIELAMETGAFRNSFVDFFPCREDSVNDSSYDVVTSSGGVAAGLFKCDCLPEMIRCVRPGGFVFISGRENTLTTVDEYRDRFEPLMDKLEMDGHWQKVERRIVPKLFHEYTGILWVYKVTKKEQSK